MTTARAICAMVACLFIELASGNAIWDNGEFLVPLIAPAFICNVINLFVLKPNKKP